MIWITSEPKKDAQLRGGGAYSSAEGHRLAWGMGLSDSYKLGVPRVPCVPPTLEAPVYKGFAGGTPKMKNRNTS